MYPKELVRLLQNNGWTEIRQRGSHVKMKKGNRIAIIPMHSKELKKGTLDVILKRTGLK